MERGKIDGCRYPGLGSDTMDEEKAFRNREDQDEVRSIEASIARTNE